MVQIQANSRLFILAPQFCLFCLRGICIVLRIETETETETEAATIIKNRLNFFSLWWSGLEIQAPKNTEKFSIFWLHHNFCLSAELEQLWRGKNHLNFSLWWSKFKHYFGYSSGAIILPSAELQRPTPENRHPNQTPDRPHNNPNYHKTPDKLLQMPDL